MQRSSGPYRLLVVGDEQSLRSVLRDAFVQQEIVIEEAESASEALSLLRAVPVDVVLADLVMGGMTGLHLLEAARQIDGTVGFILFAPAGRLPDLVEGLRRGADDYIVKPFEMDELRHAVHRTLHHRELERHSRVQQALINAGAGARSEQSEQQLVDALGAIAAAVEARDGYDGEHVERVAKYAVAIGRALGIGGDDLHNLRVAALLHDVGKIGIPEQILGKPDRLTSEEDEVMRKHPVISASIVARSDLLRPAVPGVLHYHERWDGAGYPYGLSGEEIPIEGRILGVAEAYDAIVTTRPYRAGRTGSEAISELRRCAGAQFDATVVDAFIRTFGDNSATQTRTRPPSSSVNPIQNGYVAASRNRSVG